MTSSSTSTLNKKMISIGCCSSCGSCSSMRTTNSRRNLPLHAHPPTYKCSGTTSTSATIPAVPVATIYSSSILKKHKQTYIHTCGRVHTLCIHTPEVCRHLRIRIWILQRSSWISGPASWQFPGSRRGRTVDQRCLSLCLVSLCLSIGAGCLFIFMMPTDADDGIIPPRGASSSVYVYMYWDNNKT